MMSVCHQIAMHIDMIGKGLRIGVEIEITEAGDPAGGIDVQGAIGRRHAAIVLIAPHAANLAADFEDRDIKAGLKQVFRTA